MIPIHGSRFARPIAWLLFVCAQAGLAADVVVEIARPIGPAEIESLKREYPIDNIAQLTEFRLLRLQLRDPAEENARSVAEKLRSESWVNRAHVARDRTSDLLGGKLDQGDLTPMQQDNLERVQKYAPDSVAVDVPPFAILISTLQLLKTQTTNETKPLLRFGPELNANAATTYFEGDGDHASWRGVTFDTSSTDADGQRKTTGTAQLSIFREPHSEHARIWGRITNGHEITLVRPLGDGKQVLIHLDRRRDKRISAITSKEKPRAAKYERKSVKTSKRKKGKVPKPTVARSGQCQVAGNGCGSNPISSTDPCPSIPAAAPTIKIGFLLAKTNDPDATLIQNLDEYAAHVVDQVNIAFSCSHVRARAILSHWEEKQFAELPTQSLYVSAFKACDLQSGPCQLKDIYDWRSDAQSPSNVVLIYSRTLDNQPAFTVGSTRNLAFAVMPASSAVTYDANGADADEDLLALHELGHIFGGGHDMTWYAQSGGTSADGDFVPVCDYGHAFFSSSSSVSPSCTILCASGWREDWWSSPEIQDPAGNPIGSCKDEDVARLISERAATISQF